MIPLNENEEKEDFIELRVHENGQSPDQEV